MIWSHEQHPTATGRGSTARRCSWSTTTSCGGTTPTFKRYLPRVQAYYAVKANPDPAIVETLYEAGASFDVASMPEFHIVYENIKDLPAKERQDFIWDKIIYANPIKANETLQRAGPLQAAGDLRQLRGDRARSRSTRPMRAWPCGSGCPTRARWSSCRRKFGAASGEAVDLIEAAHEAGLVVEGLSFHVGSQTTNFENYVQALNLAAGIFQEAAARGFTDEALDIGGGFPAPYDDTRASRFEELARAINAEFDRLFPKDIEILAEPGRFLVATAATAIAKVIGKARPRRQALLLRRRRRLPHLLRHHLRPLPVPPQGLQEGPDGDLLRLRPDLRRPGHDLAGRGTARPGPGRPASTARTSAPTATPRRPGSTASRRPRSCTLTSSRGRRRNANYAACWMNVNHAVQERALPTSPALRGTMPTQRVGITLDVGRSSQAGAWLDFGPVMPAKVHHHPPVLQ